jgi:hypothetical protein
VLVAADLAGGAGSAFPRSFSKPDVTVIRGCAFGFDALVNQSVNRHVTEPGFGGLYVGLRVCADAQQVPPR